jgi:hypothetical protein
MENLKNMMRALQNQEDMVVREGPVFGWPKSTQIIIDPNTTQIEGWIGTGWLAREFEMTPQKIKEVYKKDIAGGVGPSLDTDNPAEGVVNTQDGNSVNPTGGAESAGRGKRFVWKVWDKRTGHEFIICDGWPDFLKEPDIPDVEIEGFFPLFPMQFNPVEDDQEEATDTRVYGLSAIELLHDMQMEYNRSRQGLREHRNANKPRWAAMRGLLEDVDKEMLQWGRTNSVIELNALFQGQTIDQILQAVPTQPIDPAVYDVSSAFEDIQRTEGSQEANLGGTSGDTATEASIAEGSRQTASQSNIDDLDDFLTEVARASGQVLLRNMSRDTVTKIVGPGAIWPEFTAQEIAEEVFLEVKAGSSGRPNRQLEIANFERMTPLLIQLPGIQPKWLAEKAIERLDDSLDLEDAFLEGLPSIMALNAANAAAAQQQQGGSAGTGPESDPAAQGPQGANNQTSPQGAEGNRPDPGPQPAFPAGQPGV